MHPWDKIGFSERKKLAAEMKRLAPEQAKKKKVLQTIRACLWRQEKGAEVRQCALELCVRAILVDVIGVTPPAAG